MIQLYPMIVSSNVSKIALPVICKSLESYILVYRRDAVINNANRYATGRDKMKNFKIKGNKIIASLSEASYDPNQQGGKNIWNLDPNERAPGETKEDWEKRQKDKWEKDSWKRDKEKYEKEKKSGEQKAASSSVKFGNQEMKTLALEPTWITVDVGAGEYKQTQLIGIKVLPAITQSDDQLSRLLLYDQSSNKVHGLAIKIGRTFIKFLYRIWDKAFRVLSLGFKRSAQSDTVTGNVRKDIIHNRTVYSINPKKRADIFVCLSASEINDDFFKSAGGINKLFKMGWNNIIIADDVNREASFCTMEYRGQCVAISYATMYNTFGASKVYEDFNDAKQSSGSLFKTKIPLNKIYENELAYKKLCKYRGR